MELTIQNISTQRNIPKEGFRFTDRDNEILFFLLQMKFAETADIHQSFFKKLKSGEQSDSLSYCKERIALLKRLGFIKGQKHPLKWSSVLMPTWKAYYIARDLYVSQLIPTPRKSLDLNTFSHDHLVAKLRIHLESSEKVKNWKSDLQLKSDPEFYFIRDLKHVPDAIFINEQNQKIALEMELARKSNLAYREKIKSYVRLMRADASDKLFDKVTYVCTKEPVYQLLINETKIYQDLFSIKRLSEYPIKQSM
jgi:hypothetical protein